MTFTRVFILACTNWQYDDRHYVITIYTIAVDKPWLCLFILGHTADQSCAGFLFMIFIISKHTWLGTFRSTSTHFNRTDRNNLIFGVPWDIHFVQALISYKSKFKYTSSLNMIRYKGIYIRYVCVVTFKRIHSEEEYCWMI